MVGGLIQDGLHMFTPLKTNVEHNNWWFVDVFLIVQGEFFEIPCQFSGVYVFF